MFTGIIPYALIMAVRACLGVSAQNRSAAYHEAVSSLADEIRQQMHLLIGGISDEQYRLNRWANHSMQFVNNNDTYVNINVYIVETLKKQDMRVKWEMSKNGLN